MNEQLLRIQNWEKLAQEAAFQPATMAELCRVSMRQLQRFYAKHFNQSPGRWATQLQCRLARQLISQGWSNKAVVAELGFTNASHFCHRFKRVYGVSPQSFARSAA